MLMLAEGSFCAALIAFGLWRLALHALAQQHQAV
jgi:hypothetical protein